MAKRNYQIVTVCVPGRSDSEPSHYFTFDRASRTTVAAHGTVDPLKSRKGSK